MRIQNNIVADNSHRQLGVNNHNISKNTEKLSSGFRVNRAADDAAGLAISEKMRTQIRGLNRASLNIQDGISLLQVGDGALQSIHDKMQRLRELAVQAANDTNQLLDREMIQLEFGELASEANQVVQMTNFNGRLLFDGSMAPGWEYELGKTSTPFMTSIPAADEFDTPTTIEGWTLPASMTNIGPIRADFGSAGNPIPNSGLFAMQIVTPRDGTLNVVVDFSVTNPTNMTDILNTFRDEFNSLGVGHVVTSITLDASNRIVFDFTDSSGNLTEVMRKPPLSDPSVVLDLNRPRVHVGIGGSATQANALNGTASTGPLGIPGDPRFVSNYTMFSEGGPELFDTNFTANNIKFFGGTGATGVPAAVNRASLPGGTFPSMTVTVDGKDTRIPLTPGTYPDAKSFADAHKSAFAAHLLDLDVDTEGKLVITAKGPNPSPSVGISINPATLASALGFPGNATGGVITELPPGNSLWIQAGANKGDGIEIGIPRICTRSLGISILRPADEGSDTDHINGLGADGYRTVANVAGDPMQYSLDITSHEKASAALGVLTNAINIISTERARMGAQQNRLEYSMQNVDNSAENLQAAESRIRDVDMAKEMTNFVQNQILIQSSTAMLAQANALPNSMLQLLG